MKLPTDQLDNIYVLSDSHHGHSNLVRGISKWDLTRKDASGNILGVRNFDTLEEMNQTLIDNINSIVPENGILFHLGDFSFGGKQNIEIFRNQINCKNLHLITGNHDCFDADTEFLTNHGWLKYNDITDDMKLASLNTTTHDITYDFPVARNSYYYTGDMFALKGIRTDLMITPNHKLYYNLPSWPHKWNLKEISDIPISKTIIGMMGAGNNPRLDKVIPDDIIRIAAWIITDGSVRCKPNGISYVLYQSDTKLNIITEILDRLAIQYRIEVRHRNITEICGKKLKAKCRPSYTIYIKQKSILEQYITSKYTFPSWVHELSKRQFDIFLENFILGDGTKHCQHPNTSWCAYGKLEVLNQLQQLCVCNGHRTSLRQYRKSQYVLNINVNKSYFQLLPLNKAVSIVQYNEMVSCFQTKNNTLVVRRNGKVSITGNSTIEKGEFDHLFSSRQKYLELEVGKHLKFVLFHFAIDSWNNLKRGAFHLHGHQHWTGNQRFGNGRKMDVGVDGNDLKPYRLVDVIELLKDRVYENKNDHHTI